MRSISRTRQQLFVMMALACALFAGFVAPTSVRAQMHVIMPAITETQQETPPTLAPSPAPAVHKEKALEDFPLNIALFRLVNNHRHYWLDCFFYLFANLGSGWVLLPVLLAAILWRRTKVYPFLVALAIESLLVGVAKHFFHQPRPEVYLDQVHSLLLPLRHNALPSGDTAMAFMLAIVFMADERWPMRAALLAYAVLIAYERVYMGMHYPLDVVSGALIGIVSAWIALKIFTKKPPAPTGEETPAAEG
ncbi:MAG TPA: phosphatase PAP2 family protein [Armatimonadota bacterium]|jgi:membrane-associated phospholipid phosphatase